MGLAGRAKVVGNDREEGVKVGVYLLPEDVIGGFLWYLEEKVR